MAVAAVSVLALASAAWADDKPAYGPPAKWIQVADVPTAPNDAQAPAVQAVLDDTQALLGKDALFHYSRRIARITKPEGLASGSRSITKQVRWEELPPHTAPVAGSAVPSAIARSHAPPSPRSSPSRTG